MAYVLTKRGKFLSGHSVCMGAYSFSWTRDEALARRFSDDAQGAIEWFIQMTGCRASHRLTTRKELRELGRRRMDMINAREREPNVHDRINSRAQKARRDRSMSECSPTPTPAPSAAETATAPTPAPGARPGSPLRVFLFPVHADNCKAARPGLRGCTCGAKLERMVRVVDIEALLDTTLRISKGLCEIRRSGEVVRTVAIPESFDPLSSDTLEIRLKMDIKPE